jgi:hypothetical protein
MARVSLRERIKQDVFLLDGAMGTQLLTRGLEAGKCNDYLNIEMLFMKHRLRSIRSRPKYCRWLLRNQSCPYSRR